MRRFICTILVIISVMACISMAAVEPAVLPAPDGWTLDSVFEHPQQIVLTLNGQSQPSRFWYTLITLTNQTDSDVDFYPKCELMTDTFQIIPASKSIPAEVFTQIKNRHQNKYPFLELLEGTDGKLLQGSDNARDIAIIWPDFDAQAKNIQLFITGLSNETVCVDHPTDKDEQGNPVKIFLRKTLELNYSITGDAAFRSDAVLTYNGQQWIMR
ncbi:MAG: hypothetical protein KAI59_02770 [Planctomycetes bacterium]|nr:hypothetical protein [Planctomycetota bacterium]MCK5472929.1 hypothetical protein [Planctomycetota bacterium]